MDVFTGRVGELVKEFGHIVLALLKFVGFLLVCRVFTGKERHNEVYQLLRGLQGRDLLPLLDHSFDDLKGNRSTVGEFHVLHQLRVVVHGQNLDREALERDGKELNQEFHRLLVIVGDGGRLKDRDTGLEDGVDLFDVVWVGLDAEIQESDL
jgi:hypothetical protein